MFGNLFPQTWYQFRSIWWVHADNKENNGKENKSELGNIKKHSIYNREDEHIYQIYNRIDKEEEQTCQKFVFIPFHWKDDRTERDNYLKKPINYQAWL